MDIEPVNSDRSNQSETSQIEGSISRLITPRKICCRRCGSEEPNLHQHHIIPKCIGGTDFDGRIRLCKKCHDIIHNMLPMFMIKYLTKEQLEETKQNIKIETKKLMRWM